MAALWQRDRVGAAGTSAALWFISTDSLWHAWVKGLDPLKMGIQKNHRPRVLGKGSQPPTVHVPRAILKRTQLLW